MTAPRALFYSTSYPSTPVDRAGPFVHALARALVRSGVSVRVLAPAWGSARGVSEMEGVTIHRFQFLPARWQTLTMGFGGVPVALRRAPWRLLQLPLLLVAAAALSVQAARDADVLHAHWLPNLLPLAPAAWLRHRPRVVTLWGTDVQWFERSPALRPALGAVLRGADSVVAINDHMRTLFAPRVVSVERIALIPSGVDTDLFRPRDRAPLRTRVGLSDDAVVVVLVGSLIPRKGVDVALKALANIPDERVTAVVIGEGSERGVLEELAAQLGLTRRVRFAGECSLAEVAGWMSAADAFLLPSHYEGRPNVVLEAQASGLAVIASDIPGCRDLIEHGETGLLVPAGDVPALAAALTSVAGDAALRTRLGTRARAAIHDRGYTWDACARRYRDLYLDLLRG
ncbi:MAG: glycosyltransferase family 4 protein [Deltaproteobacteria bacterium]|nr:glycosyltransferase family 4 protein [Deltaproteobacteria bacterium]